MHIAVITLRGANVPTMLFIAENFGVKNDSPNGFFHTLSKLDIYGIITVQTRIYGVYGEYILA